MSSSPEEAAPGAVPRDDLRAQTVRGVGWTGAASVVGQVLQLVISVVLTRLLLPEDFGLLAMVVVFSGFALVLSDLGLGPALVQRPVLTVGHSSTAFWCQVLVGIVVGALFAAAAPLIAWFYGDHRLVGIGLALAASFPIACLSSVQKAMLTRSMAFGRLAVVELAAVVVGGLTAIGLAAGGAGPWSLVGLLLTNTVTMTVTAWALSDWYPRRMWDRSALAALVGYSRALFGFNVLNYLVRNVDNLLVGKLLGATQLGLYARAYSILLMPSRQVSAVIGKVMFASMSRMADDKERSRRVYLQAIQVIALVTFPTMLGLALVAEEFVRTVFGPAWLDAVPVIRLFCIVGMVESLVTTTGWIYMAQARTDLLFRWGLSASGLLLLGVTAGALRGDVVDVAIGYTCATLLLVYPAFALPCPLIELRFRDVLRAVAGVAACTAVMGIAVAAVDIVLPEAMSVQLRLLALCGVGAAVYVAAVHVAHLAPYREVRRIVRDRLRRA